MGFQKYAISEDKLEPVDKDKLEAGKKPTLASTKPELSK